MQKLKTFSNLFFFSDPYEGYRASMSFENGYGISVITEQNSYTIPTARFEIAVLYNKNICYTTHITDDVIKHLSKKGVTKIMKQIQELPKRI